MSDDAEMGPLFRMLAQDPCVAPGTQPGRSFAGQSTPFTRISGARSRVATAAGNRPPLAAAVSGATDEIGYLSVGASAGNLFFQLVVNAR